LNSSSRTSSRSPDDLRVEDHLFAEHWGGVADQMDDFLSQIGALPH
jgi:hypothetical protein